MKITRRGAQLDGQLALPIFPIESDLFVWKVVAAKIKFVREKSGLVLCQTYLFGLTQK